LINPDLTICLAFLKGKTHTSYSSLQSLVAEVLEYSVDHGEIINTLKKVSAALKTLYEEVVDILLEQPLLNSRFLNSF
jgi:hypothetical protein